MARPPRAGYAANNFITLRVTDDEKELLAKAAPYRGLTNYVRRVALAAAKKKLVQKMNRENR